MERNKGIDYLKGIAAFTVCSGHILDNFVFYSDTSSAELNRFFTLPIIWNLFSAGGVAVVIFCLLSGWCSAKEIKSLRQLLIQIVYRYVDFLTLFLICNLVMVMLQKLGLFNQNPYVATLLQRNMPMPDLTGETFQGAVIKAVKLQTINGALWMIKYLFWGNLIIYAEQYVSYKFKNVMNLVVVRSMVMGAICVLGYLLNPLTFVTVAGGSYRVLDKQGKSVRLIQGWNIWLRVFAILFLLLATRYVPHHVPYYVWETGVCGVVCIVFVGLFENKKIKLFEFLGRNSVSIFSVHIPVIYSFGTIIYSRLYETIENCIACAITCLITFILCMLVARIWRIGVEERRKRLLLWLRR